ncbi:MAG: hypothetical protein EXR79_02790 [Myxococcales bacterium]|nr:hypothetical protein [Myxococcales bacterium]
MTIDPRDLRTLLLRITLITFAVRAVALIAVDVTPNEAGLALWPGVPTPELVPRLLAGWLTAVGGVGFLLRLPALLSDIALPVLAVAYAQAAGWGSVAGLLAGLVLAMAPFGIEAGHRIDLAAWVSTGGLAALWLQRVGLRDGDRPRLLGSAGALLAVGWLAPPALLVVPAGLWQGWRAVALPATRAVAIGSWVAATVAVLAARVACVGWLAPEASPAARWLLDPALAADASGWGVALAGDAAGAAAAAAGALAALLPGGTFGVLARQLDMLAVPAWSIGLGALLALLAAWGLWRGIVRPDPRPVTQADHAPLGATAGGAGQADRWHTLGVGPVSAQPRTLGDRDVVPHVLVVAGSLAYVAQAAWRGPADGLAEALAAARPAAALLVGVGLAGFFTARWGRAGAADAAHRRAFVWSLALVAAIVFALGAAHLLAHTNAPERMAARKVTRFAREQAGDTGAILTLGRHGLAIALLLDPWRLDRRVAVTSLAPQQATARLDRLLATNPALLVLAGDRDALVVTPAGPPASIDLAALRTFLDVRLRAAGYEPVEDSQRYLGPTAVIAYAREAVRDPRSIRPQLMPGVAP